ncbi:MAG: BlaI/MecI/CopY family transcriptional regulator [Bacteroidia bacterium]|nr:BlaI/MecI/CopY family transcriptional regulator [Bacteroidia bacterium]
MKRLTRKEEDAMKILWMAGKGFVKDLIDLQPDPKPHYNTFSTLIRGLEDKGFIGHKAYGKNHEYFPLVTKEAYRKSFMKNAVTDYFESSYRDVVSFFVEEKRLNSSDLKEIIKLIKKGKKNE